VRAVAGRCQPSALRVANRVGGLVSVGSLEGDREMTEEGIVSALQISSAALRSSGHGSFRLAVTGRPILVAFRAGSG
jgi:hypothetical protein